MIYVMAGDFHQAEGWAARNHVSRREYRYLSRPDDLLGAAALAVFIVGTFYDRPDAWEFLQEARLREAVIRDDVP
jgi:hypothetical protein